MARRGYEFDKRTREAARIKWHRDNPGREDEQLEVDHKVPIWYAKKNGIPPAVIKSQDNARALPVDEHKERDHYDEEEINFFLSSLTHFIGGLFN